jgi:hypothetical protein
MQSFKGFEAYAFKKILVKIHFSIRDNKTSQLNKNPLTGL